MSEAEEQLLEVIEELRERVRTMEEALRAVLSSALLEAGGHDWRTCSEPSCVMARAALGEKK